MAASSSRKIRRNGRRLDLGDDSDNVIGAVDIHDDQTSRRMILRFRFMYLATASWGMKRLPLKDIWSCVRSGTMVIGAATVSSCRGAQRWPCAPGSRLRVGKERLEGGANDASVDGL
eukprot:5386749-Pyramimonas_sp.AAC.1